MSRPGSVASFAGIQARPSNAHLMAELAESLIDFSMGDDPPIYFFQRPTIDVTFGRGGWWTRHWPALLEPSDGFSGHDDLQHELDWRLPWPVPMRGRYGFVCYDPPYRLSGAEDRGDYGLEVTAGMTTSQKIAYIEDGARSCAELLAPGGVMLAKVQNQTVGGRYRPLDYLVAEALEGKVGGKWVGTLLVQNTGSRGQPPNRKVRSPDCNFSQLVIFQRQGRLT